MHVIQKLVDCCFSIALTLSEDKSLRDEELEKKARWIAHQLKECGFNTHPQGASWGVFDGSSWIERKNRE